MAFDVALNQVLENEGGFAPPDASGAPTLFGVNKRYWPKDYAEIESFWKSGNLDKAKDKVAQFYKQNFYDKYGIENLPDDIQPVALDAVVNHRPEFGKKIVEMAQSGKGLNDILNARQSEYTRLAQSEEYQPFKKGWDNRLNKFREKQYASSGQIMNDAEELSDDDIIRLYGKPSSAEKKAPTSSAEPVDLSDEDIVKLYGKSSLDTTPKPPSYKEKIVSEVKTNLGEGLSPQAYERAARLKDTPAEIWQGIKNIATPIGAAWGGKEHFKESMKNLVGENKMMEELDPWHIGRGIGEMALLGPAMSKVSGAVAPAIEKALPTVGKFITGGVENNAVRNAAGQLLEPATWGNLGQRVLSKVIPSEIGIQAYTAATQGASEKPYTQQAKEAIIPGLVAGPAAELITSGVRGAWDKVANEAPKLAKDFYTALKDDGINPTEVAKYLDENPDATVMDAVNRMGGGEHTLDLAAKVGREGNFRSDKNVTLNRFLEEREAQAPDKIRAELQQGLRPDVLAFTPDEQPQRLATALDNSLNKEVVESASTGQPEKILESAAQKLGAQKGSTFHSTAQEITDTGLEKAKPLYEEAFKSNPAMVSKELDSILDTEDGKSALKQAVRMMQRERKQIGIPDAELTEQARLAGIKAEGGAVKGLNLRTLDYVKRALDDMVQSAKGNDQRTLAALRNDLRGELDNLDPSKKYSEARAISRGYLSDKNALEIGQNELLKRGDTSHLDDVIKDMSQSEKASLQKGLFYALQERLESSPSAANRLILSSGEKKNIAKAFNTADEAEAFIKDVQNAQGAAKNYKEIYTKLDKIKDDPKAIVDFLSSKENKEKALSFFKSEDDLDNYLASAKNELELGGASKQLTKIIDDPQKALAMSEKDIRALPFSSKQEEDRFVKLVDKLRNESEVKAKVYKPLGTKSSKRIEPTKEEKAAKLIGTAAKAANFLAGGQPVQSGMAAASATKYGLNKLLNKGTSPMSAAEAFQASKAFFEPNEMNALLSRATAVPQNPSAASVYINRLLTPTLANAQIRYQ